MGLYDRVNDERRGRDARTEELAQIRGSEIANEQRNAEKAQAMEQQRQEMNQEDAYNAGVGMGMGSQTIESMQQQQAMQEQSMNDAAMNILSEIQNAQSQGASQEQIQKMMKSIPPELQGIVGDLYIQQQEQAQAQQEQTAGSPINEYANSLLT